MEISITAITKNRQFGKALTRNCKSIAQIEHVSIDVVTSEEVFDILQVIFMDRSEDYIHPIQRKNDRIYQVEVGMGEQQTFVPQNDEAFLALVRRQVIAALRCVPLAEVKRTTLLERLS